MEGEDEEREKVGVVLLLVFAPNMPMGVGGGAQGDMHSSQVMRQRKEALRGLLCTFWMWA